MFTSVPDILNLQHNCRAVAFMSLPWRLAAARRSGRGSYGNRHPHQVWPHGRIGLHGGRRQFTAKGGVMCGAQSRGVQRFCGYPHVGVCECPRDADERNQPFGFNGGAGFDSPCIVSHLDASERRGSMRFGMPRRFANPSFRRK